MDGHLNIENIENVWENLEIKEFNDSDITDIVDMMMKEGGVGAAMRALRRAMVFHDTQVSYGKEPLRPLMNLCVTEYWCTFADGSFPWDVGFGIVIYRTVKRRVVTSPYELHTEEDGNSRRLVQKDGTVLEEIIAPVIVSYDLMFRARMFKKDDQIGVLMLNEKMDAVDKDLKAYMIRPPCWMTGGFDSPCASLLSDYRQLAVQKKLFTKCAAESAFPRLMLTRKTEKPPKQGDDGQVDLLGDIGIMQIINDPEHQRQITLANSNGQRDPEADAKEADLQQKKNAQSTHSQFVRYLRTSRIPDPADSVYIVGDAYTASLMPPPVFLGNVSQISELFDIRVASVFSVNISFIRPSLGTKQAVSVTEDHIKQLKESAHETANVLAKFLKHVWCMDVYENTPSMQQLVINIPISDKMALEEIIMMAEQGYIGHQTARKRALESNYIEDSDKIGGTKRTKRKKDDKKRAATGPPGITGAPGTTTTTTTTVKSDGEPKAKKSKTTKSKTKKKDKDKPKKKRAKAEEGDKSKKKKKKAKGDGEPKKESTDKTEKDKKEEKNKDTSTKDEEDKPKKKSKKHGGKSKTKKADSKKKSKTKKDDKPPADD